MALPLGKAWFYSFADFIITPLVALGLGGLHRTSQLAHLTLKKA